MHEPRSTRLPRPAAVALLLAAGLAAGCSGGGGGAAAAARLSSELVYSTHRDLATARLTPVLGESGGGFDAAEVDSPSVAIDSGRPNLDKFLLYYEATDAAGVTTIGVATSGEEDFLPLFIGRTQVIGRGGAASGYDFAATDPSVVVDKRFVFNLDGRYRIWFEGRSGVGGAVSTIVTATSPDGLSWGNFAVCTGLDPSFGAWPRPRYRCDGT
ncbi:MAG: hypothetical protein ACE5JG_06955, partial [Planctomycetota bacterium]